MLLSERRVPAVLENNDIPGFAKYIQSEDCRNICVAMCTCLVRSAHILHFNMLRRLTFQRLRSWFPIGQSEAVFSLRFIRRNLKPYTPRLQCASLDCVVDSRRSTSLQKNSPITHGLFKLLYDRSLLLVPFTQNIETLESRANLPPNKAVEVHGSFSRHRCIDCTPPSGAQEMKRAASSNTIPRCLSCGGLVKPNIAFFGENLVRSVSRHTNQRMTQPPVSVLRHANPLLVMSTSLVVAPFAQLAMIVRPECPRVLVNMTPAGHIGEHKTDVVLLGKRMELPETFMWRDELQHGWNGTSDSVGGDVRTSAGVVEPEMGVGKLKEDIGAVLTLGEETKNISNSSGKPL
ncbi:DHS-like NAD/FAD-binding domain-containing protein [Vararia minispora EC-137]|uniref:DHS-like NAD/FAD-binding domain-containing protein n=1 Tax=Vararia minispora EC-137 TaxID=1314806 RepID=A0ACB8QMA9_9AGAM|nr:DHS-like NAD/FAD-binding domain-containing protein [Vararia minispora EC-137]